MAAPGVSCAAGATSLTEGDLGLIQENIYCELCSGLFLAKGSKRQSGTLVRCSVKKGEAGQLRGKRLGSNPMASEDGLRGLHRVMSLIRCPVPQLVKGVCLL